MLPLVASARLLQKLLLVVASAPLLQVVNVLLLLIVASAPLLLVSSELLLFVTAPAVLSPTGRTNQPINEIILTPES